MASTTRAFFIGVGATVAIVAAGFTGGLVLASNVMQPTPVAKTRSAPDRLAPLRVILPATAEATTRADSAAVTAQLADSPQTAAPQPTATISPVTSPAEAQQNPEKDKQAEKAARRKAEADQREHRRRLAERKARRDAMRIAGRMQLQEQVGQKREPSIMAFDAEQSHGFGRGLFDN